MNGSAKIHPPAPVRRDGQQPPQPGNRSSNRVFHRHRVWLVAAVLVAAAVVAVYVGVATRSAPPGPATSAVVASAQLIAHGEVRPVKQAKVGTLTGGMVIQLPVEAGDPIAEQGVIARIRSADGTEVLTAPFQGTIGSLLIRNGDFVSPGAVVATVSDLSRLEIRTTDVDEFLIGHIAPGQRVSMAVDALDGLELPGAVRTAAPEPIQMTSGDEQYPVVIDPSWIPPGLRSGMTVRIVLPE